MSDRIDELVNDLTEETWNLYSLAGGAEFRDAQISHDDILATIRELATIAREAEAQVSELQSATKNDATRVITEHVPWRSNDTHPRRVALAFIKQLEAKVSSLHDECDRLAAHIERLEAERDALLAEHEAAKRLEHWHPEGCRFCAAHDNAERVIRG